jgi:hypothetical protein
MEMMSMTKIFFMRSMANKNILMEIMSMTIKNHPTK